MLWKQTFQYLGYWILSMQDLLFACNSATLVLLVNNISLYYIRIKYDEFDQFCHPRLRILAYEHVLYYSTVASELNPVGI